MRTQALTLARLDEPNLQAIDVGSGTGFTTQWIVQFVNSRQITCVDQRPHQQKKAKAKPDLNGCTFALEDAEQIPYEIDRFDRYVSAGSLEYWPDPAQGIRNGLFGRCSRNPVAMRNENDIEFRSVSII
jgi:MPBQ/MSBQ methyltransferase